MSTRKITQYQVKLPSLAPQVQTKFQSRSFGDQTEDTPAHGELVAASHRGHNFGQIPLVQPKLTVGAPNDQYEQEADRVADQVMTMPALGSQPGIQRQAEDEELQTKPLASTITPLVQREVTPEAEELQTKPLIQREADEEELQTKPLVQRAAEDEKLQMKPSIQREADEEELQTKPLIQRETDEEELQTKPLIQREADEEELQTKPLVQRAAEDEKLQMKPVQRKGDRGFNASANVENQLNSTKGSGSPLPAEVRAFMEPRFGVDFSQVRVHTGSTAIQMNREIGAQAFTHGHDVYFGAGKSPGNDALTAHELTHVIQQTGSVQLKPHTQQSTNKAAQKVGQAAANYSRLSELSESAVGLAGEDGQIHIQEKCEACQQEDSQLMRRSSDSPNTLIQRDNTPVPIGPIVVALDSKKQKKLQAMADDAMKRLPAVGRGFLADWFIASVNAASSASEPEDPAVKENWWVALAGNLMWAATGLFPEGVAALGVVVSFGGAAAGSGAFARDTAPSGRALIADHLAQSRDQMEKSMRPKIIDTATDCVLEKITDPEQQDQRLWQKLFPGVAYEKRSETITKTSREKINAALTDFVGQWHTWKDVIKECAHQKNKKDPFGLHPVEEYAMNDQQSQQMPTAQAKRVPDIQATLIPIVVTTATKEQTQACEREHPFKPTLKF